jgi:phosphate transport system permease protein
MGMDVSSESAMAAGLVMGIMIIPFVSSLSDDVINAVPQEPCATVLTDWGPRSRKPSAKWSFRQLFRASSAGFLLAVSRAIGETMIVVMAAGLTANLTFNPLKASPP